ncbi:MAG: hypothetical protein Q9169_006078 [Polycauliona sp. 2 TL-2023]
MAPLVAATLFSSFACWRVSQASPLAVPQVANPQVGTSAYITEISEDRGSRTDRLTPEGVNCWIAQHPDYWAELEMEKYVVAWEAGWKALECGPQRVHPGFGDCFIRLHEMGVICSAISEANCGTEIATRVDLLRYNELVPGKVPITDLEKRQASLCATNIVAMNAFFHTWYTATTDAFSATAAETTKITTIAAPPPEARQDAWKAGLINALLAGLAFLPSVSAGSTLLSSAARTAKNLEAPGRILLAASSSTFTSDIRKRLQPTLSEFINNVTASNQMARHRQPSAVNSRPPTRQLNLGISKRAIRTYITSVALQQRRLVRRRSTPTPTSPNSWPEPVPAGGKPNLDYKCESVDAVYAPLQRHLVGRAQYQGSSFLNNPYDKFVGYFDSPSGNPITSPEALLLGAAECRLRAGWGTIAPLRHDREWRVNQVQRHRPRSKKKILPPSAMHITFQKQAMFKERRKRSEIN